MAFQVFSEGMVLRDSGLRLEKLLGRGGQAEVWRCADLRIPGRTVAAKLLAVPMVERSRTSFKQERHRMEREIEHNARVIHDNVVRIYSPIAEILDNDFLVTGFVMELSPWGDSTATLDIRQRSFQGTLSQYMRDSMPFALNFLVQLARGLRAIQQHDLVHSDIKPANILCFPMDGPPYVRLKLTDFGMTTLAGEPSDGAYGGTPPYMPPEQAGGEGVSSCIQRKPRRSIARVRRGT